MNACVHLEVGELGEGLFTSRVRTLIGPVAGVDSAGRDKGCYEPVCL